MTTDIDRALSPVPLMQLATGFWAFKTLAAAHEFDLFSRVSGTAGTTAGQLAEALAIEERPADMLLTGCAALGLLVKSNGRYVNSPLAEEFLVRGKPYYFGGFVQMLGPAWPSLRRRPGGDFSCRQTRAFRSPWSHVSQNSGRRSLLDRASALQPRDGGAVRPCG